MYPDASYNRQATAGGAPDRASLAALARASLTTVGVPVDDDWVDRVVAGVPADATWMEAADQLFGGVGLRVSWSRARPSEAAAGARPDLPRVTIDDGPGGGWWALLDRRAGRTSVLRHDGDAPRWHTDAEITRALGDAPRLWARVAPMLPAALLSPAGSRQPFERLIALVRAERDDVIAIVAFAVATGVLSLATPLAIQVLINWLAFGALLQPVVVLGGVLLVCLTLAAALKATQRYAIEVLQRRLFVRMVSDLLVRLRRVQLATFDRANGPELANRFFDVVTLQKAANALLLDGLSAALQAGVGLVLLAFYHPILLAFDALVIAAVAVALVPGARGAQYTAIKESKAKYEVAGWIEELTRHPAAFRLGGATLGEARGEGLTRAYLTKRADHFRYFFRQYLGMQAVQVAIPVTLLVACGWLVLEGQLTLGQLVAAEFIVASALAGLAKFTDKLETVYDLLAGVDKLGGVVDLPVERVGGLAHGVADGPASATLRGLSCAYEGGADGLRDVDLDVPAGARLAVVGAPGSGKSLLAEVLLGLRAPRTGAVLRDGAPLASMLLDDAYAEGALVRADGLVAGTVRDNLLMGRPAVDEAHLWRILDALGIAGAIRDLPGGLETWIGGGSGPLSDVAARAVLVARAVLGSPRLIVVDGLLDGASAAWRDRMLSVLCPPNAPWTLVLLTDDSALGGRLPQTAWLAQGALHVRADRA
jgi:putative ABC transport system ATP-binding protein